MADRWTLAEALAWVSARQDDVLLLVRKDPSISSVAIFVNVQRAYDADMPNLPELPDYEIAIDIWKSIAAKVADGTLKIVGNRIVPDERAHLATCFPCPDALAMAFQYAPRDGVGEIELAIPSGQIAWRNLSVKRAQFVRLFPPLKLSPSRPGRRASYDWQDIKLFVEQNLEENGDFDDPDCQVTGWRSQNDLVRRVQEYMANHRVHGKEPSDSTVKSAIAPMIALWRAGRE